MDNQNVMYVPQWLYDIFMEEDKKKANQMLCEIRKQFIKEKRKEKRDSKKWYHIHIFPFSEEIEQYGECLTPEERKPLTYDWVPNAI